MTEPNEVTMTATEALDVASAYYRAFAGDPLDKVIEGIRGAGPELLARDVIIVREVIERFMDIHMALQLQLQDMGYAVEIAPEYPPTKLIT